MARKRERDDTVKLVLRLPPALHRRLTRLAAHSNQSLNSEMIQRLEASLGVTTTQEWGFIKDVINLLALRYAPELWGGPLSVLNAKLDKLIAIKKEEEK
jgi:hypothetical protein